MPNYYSPYPYPQQYGYQVQQPQQQTVQQQIQNGGFLTAPSEEYVKNYPVALGNCVTFKIEGQPFVMEKSMGFSQLESPKIEKYRLIKEDMPERSDLTKKDDIDIKSIILSIDKTNEQIDMLWDEINKLKNAKLKNLGRNKRDKDGDDEHDEQSE